MSRFQPETRPYTTITSLQVGERHFQLGTILESDIGKRVIDVDGVKQVENDQQLKARRKREKMALVNSDVMKIDRVIDSLGAYTDIGARTCVEHNDVIAMLKHAQQVAQDARTLAIQHAKKEISG